MGWFGRDRAALLDGGAAAADGFGEVFETFGRMRKIAGTQLAPPA